MSKKIEITEKQAAQFNQMLQALSRIRRYQSPDQLRRGSEKSYGLGYEEALEYAYENMKDEARVCKRVKPIKVCTASTTPIE